MNLLPVFLLKQQDVLAVLLLKLTQLETMLVLHLTDRVIALFQVTLF